MPGKKEEKMTSATEIIYHVETKLIRCRIVLCISLAVNAILAAVLIFR